MDSFFYKNRTLHFIYIIVLTFISFLWSKSYDLITTLYYAWMPLDFTQNQEYSITDSSICLIMILIYGIIYYFCYNEKITIIIG